MRDASERRGSVLSRTSVLAVGFWIFASSGFLPLPAPPLVETDHDDDQLGVLASDPAGVDEDTVTSTLSGTSPWSYTVSVTEQDEVLSSLPGDVLSVSGTISHVVARHGEPANTNSLEFDAEIDASTHAPGDFRIRFTPGVVDHGTHLDLMFADLDYTVAGNDITSYELDVWCTHANDKPGSSAIWNGTNVNPIVLSPVGLPAFNQAWSVLVDCANSNPNKLAVVRVSFGPPPAPVTSPFGEILVSLSTGTGANFIKPHRGLPVTVPLATIPLNPNLYCVPMTLQAFCGDTPKGFATNALVQVIGG